MSIRQLILHNFWLKALSFVVALLIWLVVQTEITGGNLSLVLEPGSSDTRSFELQLHLLKAANDGRMIHVTPDSVTVTIQGDKGKIFQLDAKDLRAYVDLADNPLQSPNARVRVRVDLPDNINLKKVVPPEVRAEIVPSPAP